MHLACRNVLRALLCKCALQVELIERPDGSIGRLEHLVHVGECRVGGACRVERIFAEDRSDLRAECSAFTVEFFRAETAEERFGIGDGLFEQALRGLFEVRLLVYVEVLRHLAQSGPGRRCVVQRV